MEDNKLHQTLLLKTQKLIFFGHLVTTIFVVVGLFSQMAFSTLPAFYSLTPIALAVITFVVSALCYFKYKGTYLYSRFVIYSFLVVYAAMLFLSEGNNAYPYIIPLMIGLVMTLDVMTVRIAAYSFLAINIIKIITMLASNDPTEVAEYVMIAAIVSILTTVCLVNGVRILTAFVQESIENATEGFKKNEEVAGRIRDVAASVKSKMETVTDAISKIETATDNMNNSIRGISDGVNDNANAIMGQTDQTNHIAEIIDNTNEKTRSIMEITDSASESVNAGTRAMTDLEKQVLSAMESGHLMKTSAENLKERSESVREITNMILNISSQTNLLALNASIEAARAGEAGKGFAVVADEIRQLAEQTKSATEQITNILDKLAEDANDVVYKVDESVTISNSEKELADTASERFAEIKENVDHLLAGTKEMAGLMKELVEANKVIVDSVTTLSAGSEEIAASTQQVSNASEENVQMVRRFSEIMEEINSSLEQLQS